jgi:hypothetical protein
VSNALYGKGRQSFLEGGIAWLTDTIKAVLVDVDAYGKAITGATNASPIVVTSTAHGFANGDVVTISKVGGNTAANGKWTIQNVAANTFELAGSTGNGAYTSGGIAIDLSKDQFLSDIAAGARIATSAALASKTSTLGVADAADFSWTGVSGAQSEAIVVYKDTGSAATSNLIAFIDTATNLPVTPNGGDITVTLDNGANRIFAL